MPKNVHKQQKATMWEGGRPGQGGRMVRQGDKALGNKGNRVDGMEGTVWQGKAIKNL